MAITIRHTHQDGTTLEGSHKGDGVYGIVRLHGFTYRRSAGIFIMGSRDKNAPRHRIDAAAAALRAAGHEVEVDIDDTWRPAAVREADRAERVTARVERLEERAGAAAARADAAHQAARAIGDHIPVGQPILVGHHSEGRHRRDLNRIDRNMRKSIDQSNYAGHLADRAAGAAGNEAHKRTPGAMARRIETLQADVRRRRRNLEGYTRNSLDSSGNVRPEYSEVHPPAEGEYAEQLRRDIERDEEEIAHLRGKITAMAEGGEYDPWTRADLAKGDEVLVGNEWLPVRRLNAKTVSVPDPLIYERNPQTKYTRTVPYRDLRGRRRDGTQHDRPHGEPWPVEQAVKVARWRGLLHTAKLHERDSSRAYTAEIMNVGYAQRLVHGLDLAAADAEVEAFWPDPADIRARRALAVACLAIYDRLQAGERVPDIAASITPIGAPSWRLPNTEPESCHAEDLQPGWLVVGIYDNGPGGYKPQRGFTGPVAQVGPPNNRHESGTWVTVTLTTGAEAEIKAGRWVAYHPAPGGAQR